MRVKAAEDVWRLRVRLTFPSRTTVGEETYTKKENSISSSVAAAAVAKLLFWQLIGTRKCALWRLLLVQHQALEELSGAHHVIFSFFNAAPTG